ncbi:alpha/beta-hydrolase [Cadophora sp. DSE1049]|nr:alpha/beta-hydrolase [Cadophora sp. DSE1049]
MESRRYQTTSPRQRPGIKCTDASSYSPGIALAIPSPKSLDSDVTILSDNDLQGPGGPGSAFSAIYISRKQSRKSAIASCGALGERLWFPGSHKRGMEILGSHLKSVEQHQAWISSVGKVNRVIKSSGDFTALKGLPNLPVFCTQTAPYSNATFRDRLTFRFRGVRFAPQPKRFTYPTKYNGSGEVVPALLYGPQCIQLNGGSEDCLFLNIWTPSLPSPIQTMRPKKLKPVLFWVFGGGFIENSAADPNFDSGNMASRGDVVIVAVNYRVGAFGFLALNDGVTNGNFGIADQILGLDWVRKHIQDFGGDPEHITIVGQSSGAVSVRAIVASPRGAGKFVAAISMSTPDGPDVPGYSDYLTIEEAVQAAGGGIVEAVNCTDAQSQVDCLRKIDARTLFPISMRASFMVIDGTYLTTRRLQLEKGTKAPYRFMTGFTAEDAAPFLTFPPNITGEDQEEWLTSLGFPNPPRSLFPLPNLKNETLAVYHIGARLFTDRAYRCMNQATAYAGLKNVFFDKPRLDLCEAPRSPEHPFGDPNAEMNNFICYSGQLLWVFGNIRRFGLPYRDERGDREFEMEILDRWAAFVRGGTPDVKSSWKPAVAEKIQIISLKWPKSTMTEFRDIEQCEWLGLPLDFLFGG